MALTQRKNSSQPTFPGPLLFAEQQGYRAVLAMTPDLKKFFSLIKEIEIKQLLLYDRLVVGLKKYGRSTKISVIQSSLLEKGF